MELAALTSVKRDYLRLPSRPTLLQIKIDVCRKHGVTMNELMSRRRHQRIALARMEGYWRAREETSASFPEIARAFNRDCHTTVMSGAKKHAKRVGA